MGVLSKLATVNPKALGAGVALCAGVLFYVTNRRSNGRKPVDVYHIAEKLPGAGTKKESAAVDLTFFRRLFKLLRVLVPGTFSPEVGFLVLVAVNLVLRTWLDIWMIQNGTAIEGAIISRNKNLFLENLFRFIYAMPMIAIVNSLLKYGLNELKLRFRTRLSTHLYNEYMSRFVVYKMTNLDNRIRNPDQLLTQDVEKFCDTLAELYSNISKPILDIFLYAYRLTHAIGAQGPLSMLGYLLFSGFLLTRLRAPAGSMTAKEQHLEGKLRFVNSRVITNSEEISFMQGSKRERITIMQTFGELVHHLRKFILFQFSMGFIDNIIAKYVATVVGYMVVSQPFLNPAHMGLKGSSHSERTLYYYRSGRMLVRMSQAMGRLVLSGREMTRLAGYVARVSELTVVLKDIAMGNYEGPKVTNPLVIPGTGEYVEADHIIRFENVPLMTPNHDVLVKSLNFEVKSGMNVLVCGPNGCGKSSLFRILGELWPLFGGRVVKPKAGKLFYIPQRPYMTLGTLRDQVIYPDTAADQQAKGISDDQIAEYLEKVQLSYLLEREGGWEAVNDWMDVLSGGEKQRMAMARLFYHEPQFAILDECTSAVSMDVEGFIYSHCREKGITLFTVSHRKSLWKHHEYVLQFDGRGAYEYKPIDASTEEFGS